MPEEFAVTSSLCVAGVNVHKSFSFLYCRFVMSKLRDPVREDAADPMWTASVRPSSRERVGCGVARGGPLVLAGDFNDWQQGTRAVLEHCAGLREVFIDAHGQAAEIQL